MEIAGEPDYVRCVRNSFSLVLTMAEAAQPSFLFRFSVLENKKKAGARFAIYQNLKLKQKQTST